MTQEQYKKLGIYVTMSISGYVIGFWNPSDKLLSEKNNLKDIEKTVQNMNSRGGEIIFTLQHRKENSSETSPV